MNLTNNSRLWLVALAGGSAFVAAGGGEVNNKSVATLLSVLSLGAALMPESSEAAGRRVFFANG